MTILIAPGSYRIWYPGDGPRDTNGLRDNHSAGFFPEPVPPWLAIAAAIAVIQAVV